MKKRTTIYLDADTARKFRLYCVNNDTSMSKVLEREIKRIIRIENTLNYRAGKGVKNENNTKKNRR